MDQLQFLGSTIEQAVVKIESPDRCRKEIKRSSSNEPVSGKHGPQRPPGLRLLIDHQNPVEVHMASILSKSKLDLFPRPDPNRVG